MMISCMLQATFFGKASFLTQTNTLRRIITFSLPFSSSTSHNLQTKKLRQPVFSASHLGGVNVTREGTTATTVSLLQAMFIIGIRLIQPIILSSIRFIPFCYNLVKVPHFVWLCRWRAFGVFLRWMGGIWNGRHIICSTSFIWYFQMADIHISFSVAAVG